MISKGGIDAAKVVKNIILYTELTFVYNQKNSIGEMARKENGDMIEIRLHGIESDLEKLVDDMKEKYEVLKVSSPYKDRGDSKLVRIYITIKSL